MKKILNSVIVSAIAIVFFQSCGTTKAQKAVDEKVAMEPAITSEKALERKQDDIIANAQGLSAEQKAKLSELRQTSQAKVKAIDAESLKLREILVKNLVASDYNSKKSGEVRVIRSKLIKLNRQRLDLTLDSIEQAQTILGRDAKNNEMMMDSFLERDYEGHGNR